MSREVFMEREHDKMIQALAITRIIIYLHKHHLAISLG